MSTTLQPIVTICGVDLVWIARMGKQHQQYGDPFSLSCVVVSVDSGTVRIEGLSGEGSNVIRELLGLRAHLHAEGFKHVIWQRIKNKKVSL